MKTMIETERLILRPFELTDARRVSYLAGDYEVAKMCGRVPHPYPVLIAEAWIATQAAARAKGEDYPFAITLPGDGLIGACGVNRVAGAGRHVWELGYWLGLPYWGEGYASEAARGLMAWAQDTLDARVFTAGHYVDNPASGGVLRKLGFEHTGSAELFGLARARTSPCERYVWPAGTATDTLALASGAHAAH
ncbi:MAG: GNAT family N-acetyltransferase [Alphaproteobacteria bacterium]|nr:GNAT family N-acetyltransferase [Alphaproteobacteria bacterium]